MKTHSVDEPSERSKLKLALALELILLYLVFPALVAARVAAVEHRWLVWACTGLYVVSVLSVLRPSMHSLGLMAARSLMVRFVLASAVLVGLTAVFLRFFVTTLDKTLAQQFIFLFVLYPIILVPVQEFFFRSFFYLRYELLLASRYLNILNGVVFSLYHIIYGGWGAVVAAFVGGLILSALYARYRNFSLCWAVHYVLGIAVYLAGFARHFTAAEVFDF